ncbi:MAG: OB-fold nucleic acid binding domain-containing protein, partial [Actinomycetes bacterium]
EYLAALLTSVKTNLDKAAIYLAECRGMGIDVLVPDVNRSDSDFTPLLAAPEDAADRPAILFGLSAVRNVGTGLVELIVAERNESGPFTDFHEFCQRVDLNVLNKRTIEALIKAGGFDSMGHPRQALLLVYEQVIDQTVARRKEHEAGLMSLFGGGDDDAGGPTFDERIPIGLSEFDKKQKLAFEKEMLGLYVSDHPLLGAETLLRRRTDTTIREILDAEPAAPSGDGNGGDGRKGEQRVRVGGVVTGLQRKWTRKGDLMGVFQLEDLQGGIEVMVFPKTMQAVNAQLVEDQVVILTARVDRREESPKLSLVEIEHFEPFIDEIPPLRLQLPEVGLDDQLVGRLKELFSDFPGESEVLIQLGQRQILRLPDDVRVDTRGGLVGELRVLLGVDAVAV